jgi:hypothetical protein
VPTVAVSGSKRRVNRQSIPRFLERIPLGVNPQVATRMSRSDYGELLAVGRIPAILVRSAVAVSSNILASAAVQPSFDTDSARSFWNGALGVRLRLCVSDRDR